VREEVRDAIDVLTSDQREGGGRRRGRRVDDDAGDVVALIVPTEEVAGEAVACRMSVVLQCGGGGDCGAAGRWGRL